MKNFSGKKRDGKEYWHIKRLRFAVQINKYIAKLLAEVGLDFENKSEKYCTVSCRGLTKAKKMTIIGHFKSFSQIASDCH